MSAEIGQEPTGSLAEPQPLEGTRFQWVEAFTASTAPAWAAVTLLGLVWLVLYIFHGEAGTLYRAWIGGAKIPTLIEAGQVWRLPAASLLHIDVTHLALNALGVYALGRLATMLFGGQRMWVIFGLTAFAGTLTSWWWSPEWSLGASGAVFGLLGAVVAAGLRHRRRIPSDLRGALSWRVVPWLTLGLGVMVTQGGQIDHAAHLGAFVVGALIGVWSPVIPLGAARRTWPTRVGVAVVLLGAGYGAFGAVMHREAVVQAPVWVARVNGRSPEVKMELPAHWVPVESPDPQVCGSAWGDGLLLLCAGHLPGASGVAEARARLVEHGRAQNLRLVPDGERASAGRDGGWVLALEFAPEVGEGRQRAWLRALPSGVDVVVAQLITPNAGDRWQSVILDRARRSFLGPGRPVLVDPMSAPVIPPEPPTEGL